MSDRMNGVPVARTTLLRWAVIGAALVLTASACGDSKDPGTAAVRSASTGVIGIAMPTKTSERWIADGTNMAKQFEVLGYRTDLQFGGDNVQTQIAQIDAMIANHDRALIIAAIDGSALTAVLQKAAAAKIPVIAYDRLIRDTDTVSYYATFDNFKVGVLEAKYLVKHLRLKARKSPATIELFAGSPDDNNASFFFKGSMSVLKPYLRSGKLVVRSGQRRFKQVATMRWDGKIAAARMTKILDSDYRSTHLDAVLAPYDGLSRGIIAACTKAGYDTRSSKLPLITGQDAELESVKAIVAGKQSQTVYKDTRELAKVAVQMTDSLLNGGQPQVNDTEQYDNGVEIVPTFLLQPVSVDTKNYRSVLVDGGYYTAAQIDG
jgi:putative multiple sugar transport system substrate-binding protein